MSIEIERKFLVQGEHFKQEAHNQEHIAQGYLSSNPERSVRIRIKDEKGYITVKGIANKLGMSRYEWEKEISKEEAVELLNLCEQGVIDKTRYYIKQGIHTFEVDVFSGENEGLVVAEVELSDENEAFHRPNWLGKEVTGDVRYYNSALIKKPFSKW